MKKIPYVTYELAMEELLRIVNTNYNPCVKRNRKPCRVYQDIDGLWYLTSKPKISY